jgi:hypothetical protein
MFEAMEKMGIPQKLVTITMCQIKVRVKIDNQVSAHFKFNKGVEQGDGLSTTLFILALHSAVQEIDQRGTIYRK